MILAPLALLVAPPADLAPPTLTATDLAFGTVAPSPAPPFATHLGLVPGATVRFEVASGPADAGDVAVLAASGGLLAVPLPIGAGFLELDPVGLVVLAVGAQDGAGLASFDLAVPGVLAIGTPLATQAATIDPLTFELRTTNALAHVVTDLALEVVQTFWHSGFPFGGEGAFGGSPPTALAIADQATWEGFWALHHGGLPPAVDFGTRVAVVGFGGWCSSGGFSLAVDGVQPAVGGGLEVLQTLTTPGFGCPVTLALTQPGQIVTVDRVAGAAPVIPSTTVVQDPPCL